MVLKSIFLYSALPALLLASLGVFAVSGADAQIAAPQLLVNWRAETYTPPGYAGKALPAGGSRMVAGIDVFDQGRKVDLSGARIFWYLNDNFYQGAPGLTNITFQAPSLIGNTTLRLRVSLPDYGGGLGKTVSIPVVTPEVVVGSSAPSLAAASAPFILQAYPYFWNVQDALELQYSWSGGGSALSQNPFTVTREMARDGRPVPLELTVSNPTRPVERVVRDLLLFPEL